jgi:hypothetical protein
MLQQMDHVDEEADRLPESICWDCARSSWPCLCGYPDKSIPEIRVILSPEEYSWPLFTVLTCPLYWPE